MKESNNKSVVTLDSLEFFQLKIKYCFKNINLLQQALTHKSYNKQINNERLEFLGDAVLDLLIGEYLFKKFESSNEGNLTKIRASIVNENGFMKLANVLNLGEYIFISPSEAKNNGRSKPSILSDAFEALIGAIYLDGGIESAKSITYALLELVYNDINMESMFMDYKTALQELSQAICGVIPEYILLEQKGPDHNKSFTMQVKINGVKYAKASGKSKKEAEQNCAKKAYHIFKKEEK
ncbi:MAG: ribonuclease III [Helicobacteraceae bacterium]|nr:ribonuclease III [Helicobacteraceae bacterium]